MMLGSMAVSLAVHCDEGVGVTGAAVGAVVAGAVVAVASRDSAIVVEPLFVWYSNVSDVWYA